MDPNANLREQEEILINRARTGMTRAYSSRLRLLREALAGWIRSGGFEPDWTLAPHARQYYGR